MVKNFKRDLLAVANYKKILLHNLEAEVFQYHDLIKQDLTGKVTFIFREDGYLGMFGDCGWVLIPNTAKAYGNLKVGEIVTIIFRGKPFTGAIYKNHYGQVFMSGIKKRFSREVYSIIIYDNGDGESKNRSVTELKKSCELFPNLLYKKEDIEQLKDTMHFALVVDLNNTVAAPKSFLQRFIKKIS